MPEVWPEARSPKPEARSPKPEARSPKTEDQKIGLGLGHVKKGQRAAAAAL